MKFSITCLAIQLSMAFAAPQPTNLGQPGLVATSQAGMQRAAPDYIKELIGVNVQDIQDLAAGKSVAEPAKTTLLGALGLDIPRFVDMAGQVLDRMEPLNQTQGSKAVHTAKHERRAFDFLKDIIGVNVPGIVDAATGKPVSPASGLTLLSALGIDIPQIVKMGTQVIDAIEQMRQQEGNTHPK